MPLTRGMAHFNRRVTNRLLRPVAGRLPAFGIVIHRGRVSGKEYQTPVNCLLDDGSVMIALTYGAETDWMKNLRAAGGGQLRSRGETYRVGMPRDIGQEGMKRMPAIVRRILRLIAVDEFVELPLLRSARPN
ncbi:MAG TPA: nitroreductase family deazaflavin-dependent oxidoreductase [Acidimicrobiia bacterium]|nr:nitroreductase family deazaflavin-dependent oxidoreductase [Acidimicrobiia bacterium]